MSFLYPLGLLGLIGVPILIIIYIIKNKYTEQTIPSTYIWKLSEKFLKRKKPISKIKGLISLIIQCLIVVVVSLLISNPSLIIKGGAKEYCFILDGSASMNKIENGKMRFNKAKEEVIDVISSSQSGSAYTVIYVGLDTQVISEGLEDKEQAIKLINKLNPSNINSDNTKAIQYAQGYFDINPSIKTYLVTDKVYDVNNIELINVAKNEINYSIKSVSYEMIEGKYDENGVELESSKIKVSGIVYSYNESTNLNLELKIDEIQTSLMPIKVEENTDTKFEFQVNCRSFNSFEVTILNDDGLDLDNHYVMYNIIKEHNYKALIVSENPFYLQATLEAYGKLEVTTVMTKEEYDIKHPSGYGLYIFDSMCTPQEIPSDGTVWYFNPDKSVENSGFAVLNTNKEVNGSSLDIASVYTDEASLLEGYIDSSNYKMYVKKYSEYSLGRTFTTLFTCEGKPVIFTGTSTGKTKVREVVIGFDLHYSNLSMNVNWLRLVNNLLDYSFPTIIDDVTYKCGSEMTYNITGNIKNIKLTNPLGVSTYLDSTSSTGSIDLTYVGSYNIIISYEDDTKKEFNFFSYYPEEENENQEEVASLTGQALNNYKNSTFNLMIILYVMLGLLFVADWMVYCYEQHQLY